MNCAQVEKLLPLFADHDLSGRREQLIDAHLQSCAVCSEAAADYRNTRELMHAFAPPMFSDQVYADMRQSVWRRIEAESRPSWFEAIAVWCQPRVVLTAAAAVMVTISVVAAYVLVKRAAVQPEIIVHVPQTVLPPLGNTGADFSGSSSRLKGNGGERRADVPGRHRKPVRLVTPNRVNPVTAYSPAVQVTRIESSSPIVGKDNLDLDTDSSSRTLRMELQTQDPNIRIIWFSQSDSKPVAHSK